MRNGTCADTLRRNQIVHILPPVSRYRIHKTCDDRLLRTFEDRSLGATTWHWDFGDGTTAEGAEATHRFAGPGLYDVRLTVTDDSGSSCAAATSVARVRVNATPVVAIP